MTTYSTRRAILAGAAAVPIAATTAERAFARTADDERIEQLWKERTKLVAESQELHRAHVNAEACLPEWAAPGPTYLHSDGSYGGPDVGWPRKEVDRLPEGPVMINVRPSPHDCRRDFETSVRIWGKRERKKAQRVYEARIAALDERIARQREEHAKVGLPAIDDLTEHVMDRVCDIDDAIKAIPTSSPTKAAAHFMLGLLLGRLSDTLDDDDDLGTIASGVLPLLRPHLSGMIAQHIDDLIEHPAKPLCEREFCQG